MDRAKRKHFCAFWRRYSASDIDMGRRGAIADEKSILPCKIWRPLTGAAMAETVTKRLQISQIRISQTCDQPTALRHDCLKAPVPLPAPEAGQLCPQPRRTPVAPTGLGMVLRYFQVVVDAAGLHLADFPPPQKFAAEEGVCRCLATGSKMPCEVS